jgi:hypothetical protein
LKQSLVAAKLVFGAVTRTDTAITALIRRNLETVGLTGDTEVTFRR